MINQYEIKKVKVSDIKLDSANPNKMSDAQLEALRYSLKKFGQLKPIIIDQTFTICDGEHQLRAYMAEGMDEVQVIQVEVSPSGRRLIRQTMNKLHGMHDESLDLEEYRILLENNELDELSKLLAIDKADLIKNLNELSESNEVLIQPIFQLVIDFDNETKLNEGFEKLSKEGFNCRVLIL